MLFVSCRWFVRIQAGQPETFSLLRNFSPKEYSLEAHTMKAMLNWSAPEPVLYARTITARPQATPVVRAAPAASGLLSQILRLRTARSRGTFVRAVHGSNLCSG